MVVRIKLKLFYSKGGRVLEQAAQTGWGLSISEDVEKRNGQHPEQPALVDPSARQVGLDLQMSLQPELFYGSVNLILLYKEFMTF